MRMIIFGLILSIAACKKQEPNETGWRIVIDNKDSDNTCDAILNIRHSRTGYIDSRQDMTGIVEYKIQGDSLIFEYSTACRGEMIVFLNGNKIVDKSVQSKIMSGRLIYGYASYP